MGAKQNIILNRANYGIVSPLAFGRFDIPKIALAAEEQTNIIGSSLGAAKLRAGMEYLLNTYQNKRARCAPFVYDVEEDDVAILEFTENILRPLVDEKPIFIPATLTQIINPAFAIDLSGWNARDDAGALSYHSTGSLILQSQGAAAAARRWQEIVVAPPDRNKRHCVRLELLRGEVCINIGNTLNDGAYVPTIALATSGNQTNSYHYFTFNPTGNFFIELSGVQNYSDSIVDSVQIVSNNTIELSTSYAQSDLRYIRSTQTKDIVYLACKNQHSKKISRYNKYSWGIEDFAPLDGVFNLINTTNIAIAPSKLKGQVTLASNANYFLPSMVNSLIKITSSGQLTDNVISGNNQYSDYIKVTGVSSNRNYNVTITGAWTGTLTLQRALGEPEGWADTGTVFTGNTNVLRSDTDDNSITYYRIGFNIGHGSGSANIKLSIGTGSITGIARILQYLTPTNVIASVIKPFGGLLQSSNWYSGIWRNGNYPSSVANHEGRLWWCGKDRIIGSNAGLLEGYNEEIEGDSAAINVIIGGNGNETINWLLPLSRLLIGGQVAERTARSNSLDEPLTPTNFTLKKNGTRGSSPVEALELDETGFFVRNNRLFNLAASDRIDAGYQAKDVTLIAPEVGLSGFLRLAIQRYPDTRIHALRNDGKVALFVFDELEEVQCWQIIETDGFIEDVFVLPAKANETEDRVYYVVKRNIGGVDVRQICKWSFEESCVGGFWNEQADSFIKQYYNIPTAVISGLQHLEGKQVVVWSEGRDLSAGYGANQVRYLVQNGQITLPFAVSFVMVGLPYTGRYKSNKLPVAANYGQALTFVKRVSRIGLVLLNSHNRCLRYGQNFDEMDELPLKYNETLIDKDKVWSSFDENTLEFDGDWNNDARVCIEMQAPRPCTILGIVLSVQTNDAI